MRLCEPPTHLHVLIDVVRDALHERVRQPLAHGPRPPLRLVRRRADPLAAARLELRALRARALEQPLRRFLQ